MSYTYTSTAEVKIAQKKVDDLNIMKIKLKERGKGLL